MKYYTTCEFTPSLGSTHSGWIRAYERSPDGFLFHDTEQELSVGAVLRPLRVLSELHENAKQAIIIKKDDHSLVATFSLASFFKPRTVYRYSYQDRRDYALDILAKLDLRGWLLRNVDDPSLPLEPLDVNAIYDNCHMFARLSGACPCDMAVTGECIKQIVLPQLPPEFTELTSNYLLENQWFKRKRFKLLNGFEYVSSKTTSSDDFDEGKRPWDAHNFTHVESRKAELSQRGKQRHLRDKHRLEKCKNCAFAEILKTTIEDCGFIRGCTDGGVDVSTAWAILHDWYNNSGFEAMPGFTEEQRNYLIHLGGTERHARVLSTTRKTAITFGGFVQRYSVGKGRDNFQYQLGAAAGDLERYKLYSSYAELKEALPDLPDNPVLEPIDPKIKLAAALLGTVNYLHLPYHRNISAHHLRVQSNRVELNGAHGRAIVGSMHLTKESPVAKYYKLFGSYYDAKKVAEQKGFVKSLVRLPLFPNP